MLIGVLCLFFTSFLCNSLQFPVLDFGLDHYVSEPFIYRQNKPQAILTGCKDGMCAYACVEWILYNPMGCCSMNFHPPLFCHTKVPGTYHITLNAGSAQETRDSDG